jgi:uncharacterized protein YdhG (YjbR/CyaY superfamily)
LDETFDTREGEVSSDTKGELPERLAAPARRALANGGVASLEQLSGFREDEVRAWHGMGPKAVEQLRGALAGRGMSFARPALSPKPTVFSQEVDRYLEALEEPKRSTLGQLRRTILAILPDAEETMSYGLPAFKVGGKTIAGFAAFKHHLSYLPHSGSVFPELQEELDGYTSSSGALRFKINEPLPKSLVDKLIAVRLRQAFPS